MTTPGKSRKHFIGIEAAYRASGKRRVDMKAMCIDEKKNFVWQDVAALAGA